MYWFGMSIAAILIVNDPAMSEFGMAGACGIVLVLACLGSWMDTIKKGK